MALSIGKQKKKKKNQTVSDGVHTLTPRICVGWLCNIVFFVGSEKFEILKFEILKFEI